MIVDATPKTSPSKPVDLDSTSMKTAAHLKRWLETTNRRWLVFRATEMVDALPWDEGVRQLMLIIDGYRQLRAARQIEAFTDNGQKYYRQMDDRLELEELRELRRWADAQIEFEQNRLDCAKREHSKRIKRGQSGDL